MTTSAVWPEVEAFAEAVNRTPADAVTMAEGWCAHDVLTHAVAGGAEMARLAEAHLRGEPNLETMGFEERESAFRPLSYGVLSELLLHDGLRNALAEMARRDPTATLDFTGWSMTAKDLATHVRSELSLHRWDLVGDDEVGDKLLAQPELTAHAVRSLGSLSVIGERLSERTRRSGVSELEVHLRVEGQPDVVLTVEGGQTRLALVDLAEGPAITSSGAGRLLMLWGRRPAPHHGTRSNLAAGELAAAAAWLFA